jgi:hypothetical protein
MVITRASNNNVKPEQAREKEGGQIFIIDKLTNLTKKAASSAPS